MALTRSRGRRCGIYPYFVCPGKNNKRTGCNRGYVKVETIEKAVERYCRHVALMSKRNLKQVERQKRRKTKHSGKTCWSLTVRFKAEIWLHRFGSLSKRGWMRRWNRNGSCHHRRSSPNRKPT